ncbi:NPP1-like protein [Phytophthora palmivora]|uniref:NPP1-like protein n=1 Tax=Phytophthora palmivora TaxID=4796 RepID=A0A2P4Y6H1_9STRA|nr:NPP1-like protein [Phytophthora palmivora]
MQLHMLLVIAFVALTTVGAGTIDHDKVQPFAQPKPITIAEKAAVKFKPSLAVIRGCHPYPAVNPAGETSAGLKGSGKPDSDDCKGSPLGSQVYSRSVWYADKWAIMYAWYFPKDVKNIGIFKKGVRHDWVNVVVWIDNPALENPTILATSASTFGNSYVISKPPKPSDIIDGVTPKMRYDEDNYERYHTIYQYHEEGEYQDLIQWDQLTDEARQALDTTPFGDYQAPFNNASLQENLKAASTITNYVRVRRRYYDEYTESIW